MKALTRPRSYRIGDIVTIDVAVLNASERPLYVYEPRYGSVTVRILDKNGRSMSISDGFVKLRAYFPEAYTLVQPGGIAVRSVRLLIGCSATAGYSEHLREYRTNG